MTDSIEAYVEALSEYVAYMASTRLDSLSVTDAFERRRIVVLALNALPKQEQIRAAQAAQTRVFSVVRSEATLAQIFRNERAVETYIQQHELWA